jgi:two-component system chemotaxis response regulator CheB/chemosensory pili system protein ChpB (putative protein-glutamate methylesterase)
VADSAATGLLRIALVYGDEADAAHLREAMQGQVEIAYAASAAEFDAARLGYAVVAAALVNVDGGDWLEAIEASLDAQGIPVVYNDPDISRGLEGWARARWLRHLLAKLRGSTDMDPPRPTPSAPVAARFAVTAPEPQRSIQEEAAVVERPLSPQEIASMTADFVAVQPDAVAAGEQSPSRADANTEATSLSANAAGTAAVVPPQPDPLSDSMEGIDSEADGDLDVDTETLSAMIDARLADAEAHADSTEVWRLVETGTAADAPPDLAAQAAAPVTPPAGGSHAGAAAPDDAEVLAASLPALDDWQLVDADAPPAPAPASAQPREDKRAEFALSDSLAGLELVPMETVSVAHIHTDPIERWLHESEPRKAAAEAASSPKTASQGGKG